MKLMNINPSLREIDGGELLVIEEKDEMGLLVIGFGIGYRRN
ncbi:hypothetical protein MtrunA17_Chr7g0218291 [Medicago truncatula]|uniref:Uncharacterized protein n=1 Tax=Medicago truncatula TaxID=3880 RepID=A0A396GT70_MEDTR|nr:hypothetical protein MtrunA17_Chr7g0218291 [Medicago truncatula]